MAPPPPASMPLTQRFMQLAQTLQFGWFVGHLTLLFCTLRYGLSYITINFYSRWAVFSYRTAFVAAAATYGIVVFKAYRARSKAPPRGQNGVLSILTDENVQYLAMALVWLYSRQTPLALLPFTVYSVFHIATYTRTNLLPTVFPPPTGASASPGRPAPKSSSPLAETIGRFVKEYYDTSMMLVASLEIALWFRILFSAILFTKGSWVLLLVYSTFVRARYSQSSFVQGQFMAFSQQIDALVANQSCPPPVRQVWGTIKGLAAQATQATDLRRYMAGPQAQGMKKPQ